MANRIYITHTDDVDIKEAIEAVYVCLKYDKDGVGIFTLSNGLEVSRNEKTKCPSFYVWRNE